MILHKYPHPDDKTQSFNNCTYLTVRFLLKLHKNFILHTHVYPHSNNETRFNNQYHSTNWNGFLIREKREHDLRSIIPENDISYAPNRNSDSRGGTQTISDRVVLTYTRTSVVAGVKYSSYTPPLADYFWRRRRNSEALNWLSRLPLNEIACRKVDLLLLVLTPPLFPLSHPPNTRSHRGDIKRWPGSDGKRKIDEPSKLRWSRRGVERWGVSKMKKWGRRERRLEESWSWRDGWTFFSLLLLFFFNVENKK